MKGLGPWITGVGAVAGVAILVLYVAVEFEQIQQWKTLVSQQLFE